MSCGEKVTDFIRLHDMKSIWRGYLSLLAKKELKKIHLDLV